MATPVQKHLAEFVGTFLLIFTVGCNVLAKNSVWAGVSIGSVLMVSIYAFGCISGGNFNPAVSFALALATSMGQKTAPREERFSWNNFFSYAVVQIVAGIVAGLAYQTLYWDQFNLAPAKDFGWINAGLAEFFYTFMLVFVVLNVACSKAAKESPNQFYGLAIGFVVVAGAYGAGAVSGGCFNPAVAIGIDVASAFVGFGWCLLYAFFELLGAATAVLLYKVCRPNDFKRPDSSRIEPDKLSTKLACEFIGTYMLVLTVGLNVLVLPSGSPAAAFSIAASLMCMIFALGDVSGAHFNPAVTCAAMAANKITPAEGSQYILVQIASGICAGLTYVLIYVGRAVPLAGDEVSFFKWVQISVAELVFTFVLCLVVLCVACSDKNNMSQYFGLAIGACVTVGGNAIGGISGGSLNPAVSFGVAMGAAASRDYGFLSMLGRAVIYSVVEILGGLVAAGVFQATHGQSDAKAKSEDSAVDA